MAPGAKSGNPIRRKKQNAALPSDEQAFLEIENMLHSLGQMNQPQVENLGGRDRQHIQRPPCSPSRSVAVELVGNNESVDMAWADLLRGGTGLQSSPYNPRRKIKKTKMNAKANPTVKSKKAQKTKTGPLENHNDVLMQNDFNGNNLGMEWAALVPSNVDIEHKAQAREGEKTTEDSLKHGASEKQVSALQQAALLQKTSGVIKRKKRVSTKDPYGGADGVLDDLPATASDDADTKAFVQKVKSLAAEKKRVQEARIARGNKRTAAAMDDLAGQTDLLNRQVVGNVSKFILTKCAPIDQSAHALKSAAKKQKVEWNRSQTTCVQTIKEAMSDTDSFIKQLAVQKAKFKSQQEALLAQEDNAIRKEVEQLRGRVARRNEGDLKLMKLINIMRQD